MEADKVLAFISEELGRHPKRLPEAAATAGTMVAQAALYKVDPLLVLALANVESGYNPKALSSVGARGLLQIMPATGREIALKLKLPYTDDDLYMPQYNVTLGCHYLNDMHKKFGAWPAALTAYNRGPGNTSAILLKNAGIIPKSVLGFYADLVLEKHARFLLSLASC